MQVLLKMHDLKLILGQSWNNGLSMTQSEVRNTPLDFSKILIILTCSHWACLLAFLYWHSWSQYRILNDNLCGTVLQTSAVRRSIGKVHLCENLTKTRWDSIERRTCPCNVTVEVMSTNAKVLGRSSVFSIDFSCHRVTNFDVRLNEVETSNGGNSALERWYPQLNVQTNIRLKCR